MCHAFNDGLGEVVTASLREEVELLTLAAILNPRRLSRSVLLDNPLPIDNSGFNLPMFTKLGRI